MAGQSRGQHQSRFKEVVSLAIVAVSCELERLIEIFSAQQVRGTAPPDTKHSFFSPHILPP